VRLIQPVAHTTSRDFLAVSTGEVLLQYLGYNRNARLLTFKVSSKSNDIRENTVSVPRYHAATY